MAEEGWPRVAKPCGSAPRWHGHVSSDKEAIAVPLAYARWRERQGETSGVGELDRANGRGTALIHG